MGNYEVAVQPVASRAVLSSIELVPTPDDEQNPKIL
jgi:hypothetical protein